MCLTTSFESLCKSKCCCVGGRSCIAVFGWPAWDGNMAHHGTLKSQEVDEEELPEVTA